MKMVAVARSRSTLLGAASPSMSVARELQAPRTVVASTRSRLSCRRLPRTTDPVVQPEGSITMEKLFERCAGLDIHKDVIVACVRVPDDGWRSSAGDAELSNHDRGAADAAGLAAQLRRDACRDGIDRRLLAAGLLPARGSHGVLAAQRSAPAQRPRPQDRRQGRRVDLPARRARARPRELRAAPGDPRAARSRSLPQDADEERTREVQRLEKTLQDAGIKLSSVASKVLGVSGRRMLEH